MNEEKEEEVHEINVLTGVPCDNEMLEKMGLPPYYPPEPGYEQHVCDSCNNLLWLGPRQQIIKTMNPKIQVICLMCIVKHRDYDQDFYDQLRNLGGK